MFGATFATSFERRVRRSSGVCDVRAVCATFGATFGVTFGAASLAFCRCSFANDEFNNDAVTSVACRRGR